MAPLLIFFAVVALFCMLGYVLAAELKDRKFLGKVPSDWYMYATLALFSMVALCSCKEYLPKQLFSKMY